MILVMMQGMRTCIEWINIHKKNDTNKKSRGKWEMTEWMIKVKTMQLDLNSLVSSFCWERHLMENGNKECKLFKKNNYGHCFFHI